MIITSDNEPISRFDGGYVINHEGRRYVVNETPGAWSIDDVEKYLAKGGVVQPEPLPPPPTPEQLHDAEIASLKAYLASTDWYVARYAETGTAIPDEIKAERAAARVRIDELRAQQ